jgi:hypothetical protein
MTWDRIGYIDVTPVSLKFWKQFDQGILTTALVGEELDKGDEICGAVVSLRLKLTASNSGCRWDRARIPGKLSGSVAVCSVALVALVAMAVAMAGAVAVAVAVAAAVAGVRSVPCASTYVRNIVHTRSSQPIGCG